ncbi:MAG: histidinol dehydrogenase [Chloroflexi bacterium]|nr:histidinol dehydrogenase [Chloroflexota bacterium]
MRRIEGVTAGRRFLSDRRSPLDSDLPDSIRASVREIFGKDLSAIGVAEHIISFVKSGGDDALLRISAQIDGIPLEFIEVNRSDIDEAANQLGPATIEALELAASRIESFQSKGRPESWFDDEEMLGERVTPIGRVGIYVPAGTAPLASTVLMTAIPAKVAGVDSLVLCTPAPGGALPHPAILAAAKIAGVDRVFKVGGAQAIAAMAYGTESIPAVDLICGPGNVFVTAAKKLVFGDVGLDGIFGPTETLVIADDTANPGFCAADLIAQAEHDILAMPVLITTSANLADAVDIAVEAQLAERSRASVARQAIETNGAAIVVSTPQEAIELANVMAPEHLCLAVQQKDQYLPGINAAGGIFVGDYSAEVLGDYVAGPSHVMPTSGTARFTSALSVRTFLKHTPIVEFDSVKMVEIGRHAAELARLEGLDGHAEAAEIRLRELVGE